MAFVRIFLVLKRSQKTLAIMKQISLVPYASFYHLPKAEIYYAEQIDICDIGVGEKPSCNELIEKKETFTRFTAIRNIFAIEIEISFIAQQKERRTS